MTDREIDRIAKKTAQYLWEMQNQESEWLTIEEAAKMLGLAVATVYDHKNDIGYVKRGKRIYFKSRSVKSYIEGRS